MSTLAVEKTASLLTTPITSYDQDKWSLGDLIQKRTDLGTPFIGPLVAPVFRPFETLGIGGNFIHVVPWSADVNWVFWGDIATAAVTRRIMYVAFNRATCQWGSAGYITLTFPAATAHTIRGYRLTLDRYATGTAAVSGTAVTGTGTAWLTSRLAVGSRIGFGSTDPTQISTWYEISAVGTDTSITLTGSAGTIANGPYVIEELRCVVSTTNATVANGGLFVAKGLRPELFTPGGTTIPAATTVDNIRAVYWLADAAVVTNTISCGCAINGGAVDGRDSWTQHFAYVMDTLTPTRAFKYNLRAALTLTAGKATDAWVLTTGTQAVIGTNSQINNGRMAVAGHGPGSGVNSLYFITTTRVYRAAEVGITQGSTTWITDAMTEVPPGGTVTFAATAAIAGVEYVGVIDRFMVMTSGSAGNRSYVTQYRTDGGQFDHIFLVDDKQIDQANKDSDAPDHPTILVSAMTVYTESGLCYILHPGTTALLSFIHVVPVGAHWSYAGTAPIQRLIAPRMATPGAEGFSRATWYSPEMIGGATKDALGVSADPIRVYYRISGISDNSGGWTLIGPDGDLSGVGAVGEIQLMIEFRTITPVCIPARVFAVGVSYNDGTTNDAHYRQSVRWSDRTTKQFAFRFVVAFGSTVPTLKIRIYDDVTAVLLLTDQTVGATGTWEKSTNDGGAWGAYDTADKANETTYIRYTPATLADNFKARARLTVA
mgnify:CR=1 FL=1